MKSLITLLAAVSSTLFLQAGEGEKFNCHCQACACTSEQDCGCFKQNKLLENLQCCKCKEPCNCR